MTDWRLAPGETLLWEGQPEPLAQSPGPRRGWLPWLALAFGAAILVLAMVRAAGSGGWGLALMGLGVLPLAVLAWLIASGGHRVERFWRQRTSYALTDRRALIATTWPWGTVIARYPVKRWGKIEWNGTEPGTIVFRRQISTIGGAPQQLSVSFKAIRGAEELAARMQSLKGGKPNGK